MSKRDTSTQKMGNTTNSSSVFKPLIASSLALALGVSVASAGATLTQSGGSPTQDLVNSENLGFKFVVDSDNYYTIQDSNNSNQSNVKLWNGTQGTTDLNVGTPNGYLQLAIGSNYSDSTLTADKGISVGDSGNFGVSLWSQANGPSNRIFALNLSGVANTSYAVRGNFFVEGSGNTNSATNTFNGTFGGLGISGTLNISTSGNTNLTFNNGATIGGNITISNGTNTLTFTNGTYGSSSSKKNIWISGGTTTITNLSTVYAKIIRTNSNSDGTVTFDSKTDMIGDITRTSELGNGNIGDLIVNFNTGSTLTGNIQTGVSSSGNDYSANRVTFAGATADTVVLTGNIISYGTGASQSTPVDGNGNYVTFTNGSMSGNITASGKLSRAAYNKVTFSQDGASLSGNITAGSGDAFTLSAGKNEVIFTGASGSITGTISSGKRGTNLITFSGTGENQIVGNITTGTGTNTIKFEAQASTGDGSDEISGIINGDITTSDTGTNTISATNTLTIGLTKAVSINAQWGTNSISANTIKLGTSEYKVALKTYGAYATKKASNTITATGALTAYFSTIQAYDNSSGAHTNTIEGGSGSSVSIDTISVSGSTNSNSITITDGTLNVTGAITASSGTNTIASGATNTFASIGSTGGTNTLTLTGESVVNGSITNNAGKNNISASSGTLALNGTEISVFGGGTAINTITADTLTISNASLSANGNQNGNNDNLITTNNATSSLNFSSISVNGGNNNNSNVIKMTLGGSISVSGSMTATRGVNIISVDSGDSNTLSFGTISSTSSNGKNYIAKTITTESNSSLILNSSFVGDWTNSTYQASGTLEATNITSSSGGANYLNVANITSDGAVSVSGSGSNNLVASTLSLASVTASGGSNNIIATTSVSISGAITANGGRNYITTSDSATATFSDTITANTLRNQFILGGSGTTKINGTILSDGGTNIFSITGATIFGEGQGISISSTRGDNTISINAASGNKINIATLSASGGINYLAKDIVTQAANSNLGGVQWLTRTNLTTDQYFSDTNAFTGSLSINGVTGSGSGANYISYNADETATSAIISNLVTSEENGSTTLGTAISGSNNNIYLNVSSSSLTSGVTAMQTPSTLSNATAIMGHIETSGNTNIKVVGNSTKDRAQVGILGNITNTNGTTNIVLQDTFFAPSTIVTTQRETTIDFGGDNAGNITTASGATTNLVTRFTNAPTPSGVSMYSISGAGTTNIAIQGNIDVGTYINYGKGSHVNLIFAGANTGTETFGENNTDVAGSNNQILGITYQNGVKLSIADKNVLIGDSNASFLDTYASYYSDGSTPLATVWANRTDDTDTVAISGLVVGNIYSLAANESAQNKTYNVTLNTGAAFAGNIALDANTTTAVNMVMNEGSKLILSDASNESASNSFVISTLNITDGEVDPYQLQTETLKQSNTVINIATGGAGANNVAERENFRLLVIGNADTSNGTSTAAENTGLQGNGAAVFMTYVNTNANQNNATLGGIASSNGSGNLGNAYSDRIIIANIGNNSTAQAGTYYMQFAVDANSKLGSVTYNNSNDTTGGQGGTQTAGNIAVLTVVNTGIGDSKTAGINLKTQDVLQGFDRIGGDLVAVTTDINGVYNESGAYTTYFINNLNTRGATEATQEVTASAFATNYDLYLANFNSLNKRMGELRGNDNSQGVWARVFNGSQSNDFTQSTSTYTTFQGGYDYAFGMEGANNYLGLAVSYAMSSSKSDLNALDINGSTKGIDNIKSNAVEVAIYNSYVQDEGWYNDTIAKFSYIMSDFTITGQESKYNTNNMAFTLSDEFGYRFKLGSEKEWYIDPQLEVALGYFNQSDFIQTLGLSSLEGVADGIITTRARFGSSFGYDFKKFTANKPIKASVYLGAFYEYDYITGGDVTLTTNLGGVTTSSSAISSDGRVVMNVGTNMTIKDNTRIYFDFEKSFAGKINTDYQVNVGVRYSFGENTGYTPMTAKREVAPLKVSDESKTEEKVEESKEAPAENADAQEKTTESNTQENKAQ